MKAKVPLMLALVRFLFDCLPRVLKPRDICRRINREQKIDISWRQDNEKCSQGPILMVSVLDIDRWGSVQYGTNYLTLL
jgi:hypothetical protein